MNEIKVSIASYNEIASALEQQGRKLEYGKPITIEKDDRIINPIDYKLATIRRDCADICAKVYNEGHMEKGINFIEFCNHLFNFVLTNKLPNEEKKEGQRIENFKPDDPVIEDESLKPKSEWK